MKLKIKDQIPDIEIFHLIDGEPQTSKIRDILGNGKVILFGLPGAFTSTCSKLHLPGYVANADKIKAKGIDNIFCLSVNDPFVMNAWGDVNNAAGKITMLSDPYLLFTKSIGSPSLSIRFSVPPLPSVNISVKVKFVNFTFPVFSKVIVYVIVSPVPV